MSLSATLAVVSAGHCAPAKPKASPLPAEVRAQLPTGFLSVSLFQLAPAPREKPYLFHLWTAPRRDPAGGPADFGGNRPPARTGPITVAEVKEGGLRSSPFLLDVFAPGAKAGRWTYQTSIVWADTRAPTRYALQFLDSKKKTGFVLSVIDVYEGFKYSNTIEQIYTLPGGWDGPINGPRDLSSDQSNTSSSSASLVRNANGLLQIKEENINTESGEQSVQFWSWNQDRSRWELPEKPATP